MKDIENRTWKTKYRGRVFVHAGAQWFSGYRDGREKTNPFKILTKSQIDVCPIKLLQELMYGYLYLERGAIIGEVEIVDCVENHPSIWAAEGHFHWVLATPIQYETPIPCNGKLSFWTPDAETLKLCEEMRKVSAKNNVKELA